MQKSANIYQGIKSSVKLPQIDDTVWLAIGGTCNTVSPSGDTVITQKQLTPGKVMVEKSWCPADLEPYFTQAWLKQGALYNDASALPVFTKNFFMQILKDKLIVRDWYATTAADRYTGLGTNIELTGGYNTVTPQA